MKYLQIDKMGKILIITITDIKNFIKETKAKDFAEMLSIYRNEGFSIIDIYANFSYLGGINEIGKCTVEHVHNQIAYNYMNKTRGLYNELFRR